MKFEAEKVLPELKTWNNGSGISAENWIQTVGNHRQLVGYSSIIWPEFVIQGDCILLRNLEEAELEKLLKSCSNDKTMLEKTLNHVHIYELFLDKEQISEGILQYLSRLLSETWECRLGKLFPEKSFVVQQLIDDEEGLLGYQITVYSDR